MLSDSTSTLLQSIVITSLQRIIITGMMGERQPNASRSGSKEETPSPAQTPAQRHHRRLRSVLQDLSVDVRPTTWPEHLRDHLYCFCVTYRIYRKTKHRCTLASLLKVLKLFEQRAVRFLADALAWYRTPNHISVRCAQMALAHVRRDKERRHELLLSAVLRLVFPKDMRRAPSSIHMRKPCGYLYQNADRRRRASSGLLD